MPRNEIAFLNNYNKITEIGSFKCSECACNVTGDDMETHRKFHEEINELIEWAQAVSKNIGIAHTLQELSLLKEHHDSD